VPTNAALGRETSGLDLGAEVVGDQSRSSEDRPRSLLSIELRVPDHVMMIPESPPKISQPEPQ
jgi:hypothetical protein